MKKMKKYILMCTVSMAAFSFVACATQGVFDEVVNIYNNSRSTRLTQKELANRYIERFGQNPEFSEQGVDMVQALSSLPNGTELASAVIIGLVENPNAWSQEEKAQFKSSLAAKYRVYESSSNTKLNEQARRVVGDVPSKTHYVNDR